MPIRIVRCCQLALAALLAGCGLQDSAPPATLGPGSAIVTEADLGEDWPLAIGAIVLHCHEEPSDEGRYVTFSVEDEPGVEYAVSESALEFGHPDLDDFILPTYPDRTPLEPLIERGLTLCED